MKTCRNCKNPALPHRRICYHCELANKRWLSLASQERSKARKMAKKARKDGKTALTTDNLDSLWRKATKAFYGYRCEKCGKTNNLNSHHIISRSNFGVRWDYRNCCVLCPDCHKFNRLFSAHGTPTLFSDWIRQKRGEAWHTDLVVRARTLTADRKKFLEELKSIISQPH